MADNAPEPPKKVQPPLPSSGTTGRLKAPTTKLPPVQPGVTGKVVVMLSSVAKPTNSQKILPPPVIPGRTPVVTGPMATPAKIAPPLVPTTGNVVRQPPPLPAQKHMPVAQPLPAEQRLSTTTFVKLPPKTAAPAFVSLVPKAVAAPEKTEPAKTAPPLLPPKRAEPLKAPEPAPAKSEKKKTGIIKLNTPATDKPSTKDIESIFAPIPEPAAPPVPEGWDKLHTGELPLPPGGLKESDPFQQSRKIEPAPAATPTPVPAPKPAALPPPLPIATAKPAGKPADKPIDKPADRPAVATSQAPPLAAEPAPVAAKAEPTLNPAPVPLAPAHPVHVAPPLVEKGHEETPGKLAAPHLPDSTPAPPAIESPKVSEPPKAAELKKPDPAPAKPAKTEATPPPPLPAVRDTAKDKEKDKEKPQKSVPIVLATTTRIPIPGVGEGRPALRPAVLPSRLRAATETPVPTPEAAPSDKPAEITAKPASETKPGTASKSDPDSKTVLPLNKPLTEKESASVAAKSASVTGAVETAASVTAAGAAASVVTAHKKKAPPLPPTRADRAKKRRMRGVIIFWILVPIVAFALFLGILDFGRDTRVEGQVIPPQGMSIADEVWIVSDFTSLASGVADDVAKERVPLQLAIQEAQDHVQRVQADIASREERIRLINDNIQADKDEINGVIKKSQSDSQAVYDNQGKELDDEYNTKVAELKEVIAGRAASLKLTYQPDPAFPSPEVWANAYRLALYQTPPGVDGVKEHQWIADQMKQWRDFQKSMDDRYEQMREQAAALKQANGPHIADVNAKIDDLNARIAATQGEEDPLKAELIQAQKDLADAQAAEAGLDEKYYSQLDALPAENISYHIPIRPDGRFTWVPDNPFGEGEVRHNYWMFSRAIRADGRQYWALQQFAMEKNKTTVLIIPPGSFESTKQILRPSLSPEEIEQ